MDLFRSEEVHLMQLMIPSEVAHDTIVALGEVGMLQFKDLNPEKPAFQRTYAGQIKRCDEMARQIRFFQSELEKREIPVARRGADPPTPDLDALESQLAGLETELTQLNANTDRLDRSYNELQELQLVLETAGTFFEDAHSNALQVRDEHALTAEGGQLDMGAPLLESASFTEPAGIQLGFLAGTIQLEKLAAFERLLFRATRGNMYLKHGEVGTVADPISGEGQEKSVFTVFFAGERARSKIAKICEAFSANRYPFPEDTARRRAMAAEVGARLRELHATLEAGTRARGAVLSSLAQRLDAWGVQVRREKGVYHTLNKLSVDVTRKVLVAEAWVPVASRPRVHDALRAAAAAAHSPVGTVFQPVVTYDPPPTFFRTSKITAAFQELVDAYGIARYREANPAVFTIVTFPFLFAVMFGDVGHGLLMLAFAVWLVASERRLGAQSLNEILAMFFQGRYIILAMAAFSIYTGLLYNEFFSMVTTLFGASRWACAEDAAITDPVAMQMDHTLCPSAFNSGLAMPRPGAPYPVGVDPAWHGTRTELPYLNSLKMKMSIVLGIAQMNGGILLSFLNQRYFSDSLSTWCEFVPQVIFLNSLFGYLVVLILAKWASGVTTDLYHVMIYMFLQPGNVDCSGQCPENHMYRGQAFVQVVLVLAALIAVPWMLLPKPLILRKRSQRRQSRDASYGLLAPEDNDFSYARFSDDDPSVAGGAELGLEAGQQQGGHAVPAGHGASHGSEEFDFGEVMVHQAIHAIEFVLGSVSNTASYLRLWALSLAHSQLSAVFYDRVLMAAIKSGNPIAIVIGFYVFLVATISVLMLMESLSAFLHALRLHWVEFQSKHYFGDGYKFAPFSFAEIDKVEE
ncbi:hypothetical protein APUTEX25_003367 [Auxenochlorella protothecoides]|uniref:V-type proton ATPase subunit a n=1 Tax=Auxenochlorella protothecoides TaxID=3075 RepID=A0A3M7KUZ7_AUXPR|nr:hypothetical protein APUTEX25_003367 [Auxenochlorella protothecoides]|eukprot:RMZ53545.1 hypothetical protein APUTEX25_003367 [Auxenochlorella protothecoides]